MAGKPSKPSVKAAAYLLKHADEMITAETVAKLFGLSRSSVVHSPYWKQYRAGILAKQSDGA